MPRYFIEVSYKGTAYAGFQWQQNAVTIQSEVEKALYTYSKEVLKLTGASRTDAGVHALQNYFHFDITAGKLLNNILNDYTSLQKLLYSLNSILPADIVIKNIITVNDHAHCRFDAISRKYRYYIYNKKNPFYKDAAYFYPYKIDFEKLEEAASIILNTKNFPSFSKKHTQVKNFFCDIFQSRWLNQPGIIMYEVTANRFLRGMVRGLVGTMLKVGSNKITVNNFIEIIESESSSKADFSVPAGGLYLFHIKYNINAIDSSDKERFFIF